MTAKLLAADLARILDDAAIFAHRNSDIPIINAVHLESTAKHLLAVATDRFTLGSAVSNYLDEDGSTFTVTLKLSHAQLVAKVAKSTKAAFTDVAFRVTDTAMEFSFASGESLSVPKLDAPGTFPDWRAVIESRAAEDGSTATFAVNPQYLAKFGRVTDSRRMVIKFGGPNKPALASVGAQFFGLIMPVRLGDDETGLRPPEWIARPEVVPAAKAPPKKAARTRKPAAKKAVA